MRLAAPRMGARIAGLVLAAGAALQCGQGAPSRTELAAFPEARAMIADAIPAAATSGGAHLEGAARGWTGPSIVADVPRSALEPTRIGIAGHPDAVRYTRLGAEHGRAEIADGVVRVRGATAGADAVVLARPGEIEELLVVRAAGAGLGYRVALEPGWKLLPADHGATLIDASGAARLALRAAKAWDARGRTLDVRTVVSGAEIRFAVDAPHALPMVVDPSWSTAFAPIRIRRHHTTTLLGDGNLLIVGGLTAPSTSELHDPWTGTNAVGPAPIVPRSNHTATMLLSGKVLVAGGDGTDTAEIFDPATRAFAKTAGSMTVQRKGHAAVRLASGKVLIVGGAGATDATAEIFDPATGTFAAAASRTGALGDGALVTLANGSVLFVNDTMTATEIYDPAANTWTPTASQPPPRPLPFYQGLVSADYASTATRLPDGRALLTTSTCVHLNPYGVSTTISCPTSVVAIFDPADSSFTDGPAFTLARNAPGVARLPTGQVVFAGGAPAPVPGQDLAPSAWNTAERFDGLGPATLAGDGTIAEAHSEDTATLIPGGDVFVLGGVQGFVSQRVQLGSLHATGNLTRGRQRHESVRLLDGRALVTGGELAPVVSPNPVPVAPAEIYDPATGMFTDVGESVVLRTQHTMTTLPNGKVLVAGGVDVLGGGAPLASAELFDPAAAAGSQFKATASMGLARSGHAATLLPSGKVLITGGCKSAGCGSGDVLASAEIFDPTTETFRTIAAAMPTPLTGHGAVLMGNGKVLIVGGTSAAIFDPLTETFRPAAPPGAPRDGRTAHVLPNGKVFVAGGDTLAASLYDPDAGTWSFSAENAVSWPSTIWTMRPEGRLLSIGGTLPVDGVNGTPYLFDPLASPIGTFQSLAPQQAYGYLSSAVLLGSGAVLISGGTPCYGACYSDPQDAAHLYDDGAPSASRPTITQVAAKVTPGSRVTVTGTGFASSAPEASSGRTAASPANHPFITWVSDHGDAVVPGTVLDFTDTTATWLVPATAFYGHGQLFVSVAGVIGKGAPVEIAATPQAVGCTNDAQCGSGFCVDGVCCDRRCDGVCEACSAAKKGSGVDGVCGAIPAGTGACVLSLGTACSDGKECVTGFCSQGVCCDSTCSGECQACNQQTHLGICSPITQGACGAACDGDHTVKKVGAPDVDCAPYTCEAQTCKTACNSVKDCVAPFVCNLDGQCIAPPAGAAFDDSACGCHAAGGTHGVAGALAAALAFVAAGLRRRRQT